MGERSLKRRPLCHTASKAFSTSRNRESVGMFLFMYLKMSSVYLNKGSAVDLWGRNPNWCLLSRLLDSRWWTRRLVRIFSNIFPSVGSRVIGL